jgi:L-alanine-DL-glutamate epimerase-like enolase superfamily enzyme
VGDVIERVDVYPLRLPYRTPMQFRSFHETAGVFTLLRLLTRDGAEGIAESTAYGNAPDNNPRVIAAQFEVLRDLLVGADPFEYQRIMGAVARARPAGAARGLIDVALWDLRGKLLGQPVWRLLGGGPPAPIPITAILFGDTPAAMLAAAEREVARGFRSLKVKVWRRSLEDVALLRDIRAAVGEDVLLYVDANRAYTEMEALAIFPKLAEAGVALIEDPCDLPPERLAHLSRALPITTLADISMDSLAAAQRYLRADAIGAISAHVGRTGISETLKIAALAEAAGVPILIGTDLEASVGALARAHLFTGVPAFRQLPAEIQFFEYLAADVLNAPLAIVDGRLTIPDGPGFGVDLDRTTLVRFAP